MFELLQRSAGFAAAFTVGEHTIAGAKMKLSAALKTIQSTSILSRWSQGNQLKTMRKRFKTFRYKPMLA